MPHVPLGDFRFYYEEHGFGTPVVFLHGFTLDHRQWSQAGPAAVHAGYRAILVDARGHGLSDAPETGYNRAHRVDDLTKFVESLDLPPFHLVGLSMGGSTAIAYAFEHQDRLRSLTLVSSSAAGWNVGKKMKRVEQQAKERQPDAGEKSLEEIRRKWINYSLAFFEKTGKEVPDLLITMMKEHSGAPWMDLRRHNYPDPGVDLERVHTIKVPTLILAGDQDKIFSALAVELDKRIADSRLKIYEDTGHMLNMERPEQFNRDLLEFLNEVDSVGA